MPHRTHHERFEISHATHRQLPAIALWPATASEPLPVCLFLYGGGGHHETLLSLEPLLAQAWSSGSLAPLAVACLGVPPFCFYLDDPDHDEYWQSAVAQGLLDGVRARFPERASSTPAGLVGISMGGYGALKMAFEEPARFAAVAAIAPMIEPGTSAARAATQSLSLSRAGACASAGPGARPGVVCRRSSGHAGPPQRSPYSRRRPRHLPRRRQ